MRSLNRIAFLILVCLLVNCNPGSKQIRIYTIGDSTMADKNPDVYPETGWCQVLDKYLDESVTVRNHAVNGRSTRSFIAENRWKAVADSLTAGDIVFIQFGHNDEKEYDSTRYTSPFGTYTENLERFVTETRSKGAIPVLLTPIVRRKFDENGLLTDTHGDYPEAVRRVARSQNVALIDMQEITAEWVNSLGDESSKEFFLWTLPDAKYPDGRRDDTHLSEKGANQVARLALKKCIRLKLPFSDRIVEEQVN